MSKPTDAGAICEPVTTLSASFSVVTEPPASFPATTESHQRASQQSLHHQQASPQSPLHRPSSALGRPSSHIHPFHWGAGRVSKRFQNAEVWNGFGTVLVGTGWIPNPIHEVDRALCPLTNQNPNSPRNPNAIGPNARESAPTAPSCPALHRRQIAPSAIHSAPFVLSVDSAVLHLVTVAIRNRSQETKDPVRCLPPDGELPADDHSTVDHWGPT